MSTKIMPRKIKDPCIFLTGKTQKINLQNLIRVWYEDTVTIATGVIGEHVLVSSLLRCLVDY